MQESSTAYGIYLAYIDDYLRELGEDSTAIFRAAGLDDPGALPLGERIPVDRLAAVVRSVNRQVRSSNFFLELGARIPLMAHGNLGSAIMACKDVRTVLAVMERYTAIVLPAVRVSLLTEGDNAVVEYQISTPCPELNIALVEAFISTSQHNISLLVSEPFFPRQVSVAFKPPLHAAQYRHYTHCDTRFNADCHRMVFARTQLDQPIRTANALNQRVMLQQCEDELKKVQAATRLSERLREIVSLYLDAAPSIGFVAEKLRLSERTLRRRLDEEGLCFRDLLRQIRHETARYYLEKTDLRIDSIARQLGYSETANFRKAFREETGLSPRQWRQQRQHRSG